MKSISLADVSNTADLIEAAKREPLLLREADGRAFALLEIPEADADQWALAENVAFQDLLENSRRIARINGWLTTEQIRRELGVDVA